MPIKAAARGIANLGRLVTYRLPYEGGQRASAQTARVMGANAWHSTLWSVGPRGEFVEELDQQIIPGEYRDAAVVEDMHITAWALAQRKLGRFPKGIQLAAKATPVVINE
jgi:hypothetical protein